MLSACLLALPGTPGPPPAGADPAQVLIVGDSLAVGMKDFLAEMITDREVTFDVGNGWTTPQGMQRLRIDMQRYAPQTVVVSLGTNDGAHPGVFADRVRRTMRTVPSHVCVVWLTIVRPPRKGEYEGLNRVLRSFARDDPRLQLINWDRMVHKGTVAMRDGVHPTVEGYRFRAWVTKAAVERGCAASRPE
jgi:hypothetical protein